MIDLDFPAVLYGAGGYAVYEKQQAEQSGIKPLCFVDADTEKQGRSYLGLPVISLEQAKERYGDFLVHITTDMHLRREIFEYLVRQGIKAERILNYVEMEECLGCTELDSKLHADSSSLFTCCKLNNTMSDETEVCWKDCHDMESVILKYVETRDKLIRSIRGDETCRCTGCSIIKNELRPVRKIFKTVSVGFAHPCQLSCVYCSFRSSNSRFLIKKEHQAFAKDFDYARFIEILEKQRLLHYDTGIIFAAGEITINPRLNEILSTLQKYKLSVATNGLIYNQRLADLTSRQGSDMLISVDAGTQKTFEMIKGMDAFDIVWGNIRKYTDCGVNLTAKYVFLNENSMEADVEGFINEAKKAGVREVFISADYYRQEELPYNILDLAAKMSNMAEENGLKYVILPTFKPCEQIDIQRMKCEAD